MAIGANMTKHEQTMVTVAVLAVALVAAFWYFIYQPKSETLGALSARVDSLETRNRQARVDLARGSTEDFQAEASAYAENLKLMRMLVPTTNEVPVLIEDVSTAARRVGLDLARVEPVPVIPGEHFDTYRYQLGVVGGYHDIAQFLTNVGSLSRIMAPDGVSLKLSAKVGNSAPKPKGSRVKSRNEDTQVEARFVVQTYVTRTTPLILGKEGRE